MLKVHDQSQIKEKGLKEEEVDNQIMYFRKGFPYLKITRAATVGEGIVKLSDSELNDLNQKFNNSSSQLKIEKFVPASGAASRMFKNLHAFAEKFEDGEDAYQALTSDEKYSDVSEFFRNIEKFAFFDDLKQIFEKKGQSLEESILRRKYQTVLNAVLEKEGLNYGFLPKALLKFHHYTDHKRTPIYEHLVEGMEYGKCKNNQIYIHFTVSPQHLDLFKQEVEKQAQELNKKNPDLKFNISYSQQKPSTDTIAVDLENEPFRNSDNSILFRPGGHGALLDNLNDIDADLIFIKNIDNVVPDRLKPDTVYYKKALAGHLLTIQDQAFNYLKLLQSNSDLEDATLNQIENFIGKQLKVKFDLTNLTKKEKIDFLINKLNRPIRVCGMVKNEGEPGGGPYWTENKDGTISLQIIESSQVNMKDQNQVDIFKNATHFNPVDLVCSTKDHQGNSFDLFAYRDPDTGFISQKSKDGKDLKALELPGLWNGSMSDWNTIFAEVPISTFNPVKTVNDLLREEHQ